MAEPSPIPRVPASVALAVTLALVVSPSGAEAQPPTESESAPEPALSAETSAESEAAVRAEPVAEAEAESDRGIEAGVEGRAASLASPEVDGEEGPRDAASADAQREEEEEEGDVRVRGELGEGLRVDVGSAFSLQLRARVQFRVAVTHASEGAIAAGASDGVLTEILIRRARLLLQGHVLVPELHYYIQLGFAPLDMEADLLIPLRDARLTWQFHRDIGVRFGQMKVPFGQQRVISSSALQFADRSTVTAELNLDRDIGIYLLSEDLLGLGGVFQYQLGVFGGRGRNRFGALDAAMFVGRVQVNPLGSYARSEVDFTRSPTPRFGVGLAAAYNLDSNRRRSTHEQVFQVARFDQLHLAADFALRWEGLSILGEAVFREASAPSATGIVDGAVVTEYARSAFGWFAQVGYLLPFPLELAVRYGEIRPLASNAPEARFFMTREVGGAISYYFSEHALKVQLDYFYYSGDDPAAERHQLRLQVQLYL